MIVRCPISSLSHFNLRLFIHLKNHFLFHIRQLHSSFPSTLKTQMAEPNPSNPPPPTPPIHTAEPVVIQVNPSSEPPPPIPPSIHSGTTEPYLINPSTPPPQNYSTFSSNHQNPNRTLSDRSISSLENQDLNHPFQQQFNQSHYITMNNETYSPPPPPFSPPPVSPPLQPAVSTSASVALPHQYHGFLSTFFDYFLSHIARQSTPAPPLHQLTPSGSFNFKVEPILLHVNSSVPLLNHDQLNSSSPKTISSSSSEFPDPNPQPPPPPPPLPPPPPKQETNLPPANAVAPPPPSQQPAAESLTEGVVGQPSAPFHKHQKALKGAGSLANLLPTGTVLAFQALTPTLSESGKCLLTNKILIGGVVIVCTIICFCSSFTDSFECKGKVYYGIATRKGLTVFNYEGHEQEEPSVVKEATDRKVRPKDFVHAFLSVAVFLIFACSSSQLQDCFFPRESKETEYSMVVYLPLVTGILSSFLFTIFPTKRKGIGYSL